MTENEDHKYQFLTCLSCGDEYADETTEEYAHRYKVFNCSSCGYTQNAVFYAEEDVWVLTRKGP